MTAEEVAHGKLSTRLRSVQNQLSNFADERPVSFCCFAPGSAYVATGSWSNVIKLWSVPDCKVVNTLRGHTERISGLAWHPLACTGGCSPTSVNLISAACDSTAKLWSLEGGKPLGELTGATRHPTPKPVQSSTRAHGCEAQLHASMHTSTHHTHTHAHTHSTYTCTRTHLPLPAPFPIACPRRAF